jgi:hypothetical protein
LRRAEWKGKTGGGPLGLLAGLCGRSLRLKPEVSGQHAAARSEDLSSRAYTPRSGYRYQSRRRRCTGIAGSALGERSCRSAGSLRDFAGSARGGRFQCEIIDVNPKAMKIGDRVGMTFRKLYTANGVHNYFRKARPLFIPA